MNYAEIRKLDSANGPGIRVTLFVSGCDIKCPGCFNKNLQDFNYGEIMTQDVHNKILKYLEHPHVRGLTILGGEPLSPVNIEYINFLVRNVRTLFPEKDIWCYTGYTLEKIIQDYSIGGNSYKPFGNLRKNIRKNPFGIECILSAIDVLVDGPFMQDLKHPGLKFRGSSNQRVIDMKKSIKENKIIILEGYE